MKRLTPIALAVVVAGCGGGGKPDAHAGVARACSHLAKGLRALPVYSRSEQQALTLRKLTEAYARATDEIPKRAGRDVDALAAAVGEIDLAGDELVFAFRQPSPGSGTELNRTAERDIKRLDAAAHAVGVPACLPIAKLTRERLRVPEL